MNPREAAEAMRNGAAYLDVRSVEEFELGHPEGAFNVPWELRGAPLPNPEFVRVVRAHFAPEARLIVGCQSGVRSRYAAAALRDAGFDAVSEQVDGFGGRRDPFGQKLADGWERAGLPTSLRAAPGRSYRELLEGIASGS